MIGVGVSAHPARLPVVATLVVVAVFIVALGAGCGKDEALMPSGERVNDPHGEWQLTVPTGYHTAADGEATPVDANTVTPAPRRAARFMIQANTPGASDGPPLIVAVVFPDPGTAVDVMYGPLIAEVGTTPASISIGPHICARIADTQAMAPLDYIVCRQHGYVLEYRIMEHQLPAHASVLERMTDTFNVR